MLTSFSLLPTDSQFYELEEFYRQLSSPIPSEPVSSPVVDRQLYASLLQLLSRVRVAELDVHVGWDAGLKVAAVRWLEDAGLMYDMVLNTFTSKSVDARTTAAGAGDVPQHVKRELNGNASSSPSAGGFTLDDIQQVLSAANCPLPGVMSTSVAAGPTGGSDTSVDERALKEITAYLQSEIGSHRHDTAGRPGLCGYAGPPAAAAATQPGGVNNHDAGLVVRLIPPSGTQPESRDVGGSRDDTRPTTDAGGTILVTDSNLPYLQQFLPNLQTVMQSVQSLVRCVPQSAAGPDVAVNPPATTHHRSMSLPALTTTSKNHPEPSGDAPTGHKKRKRSGHSNQTGAAPTNLLNSFSLPSKDLPSKSSDVVQTKVEPDSATSTGEIGFACSMCSRTFSKRLGLSVHIQRAHGHRRSSDSAEAPHDAAAAGVQLTEKVAQLSDDASVRNCFVKMARPDGGAVSSDAVSTSAVSMCDSCGELVSGLEVHAAVCTGRQSPPMFDNAIKSDCAAVQPPPSANTAVVEMLQLAEHFLRQHVPPASVTDQTASGPPGVESVQMMSPPPYSEAEMHMIPTARFASNRPTELAPPPHSATAAVPVQPPGKEIVYEGSRMREFVEYQCEACLLTFSSSALANTHIAGHHVSASLSAYRVYACLSCSLRYRDPRIMRHHVVYLCGGRPSTDAQTKQQLYPCAFCSKTFMSPEYMHLHARLRHGTPTTPAATPVQCVLPTPRGATSVPSLEQLVSHCRRPPSDVGGPASQTSAAVANQESSANHKGPTAMIMHDVIPDADDGKVVPHQSVIDGRQLTPAASTSESAKSRSSKAKGILYKNVFMQCEGTYYCSVCHADLTGRESKRRHRQLPCGDPKTASYSRRYSYVCPYCSERFPSQKLCRQHQIDECLPLIGVGTAELGVGEHRCPLCPKTCFGLPALKGHVVQAHHLTKEESAKLLAEHEFAVPTCGTLAVDSSQDFNGVLSPAVSSPSSTLSTTSSTFVTMSPAVQSLYDTSANVSRGDGLESDDDIPETDQPKDLFPQLYESVVGDDSHQPSEDLTRPKRNRKSRTNEFFVMMFRNYPILAKGVSMCRSCAAQLEPNATTESHVSSCTGAAAADVRRSTLFRCTHCTATFWRAKDCRTHQLESCLPAHGVKIERLTEPSVACPMCDVRSYNRSGLMSHMKFRHSLDTDGVRQVMDRCGIRKSVPPTADNIITATSSPPQYEDGSLLMDVMSRDGVMPVSLTDTTQSPTTTADMLVDGESAGCDDGVSTWRTAGSVVQRPSTDVCNSVNN